MSAVLKIPDDYSLHYLRFPGDIYAVVRVDRDGYPTIYINQDLSPEASRRALAHELHHVLAGDLWSHVSIYDVEADAIHSERLSAMFRGKRDPGAVAAAALCLDELRQVDALSEPARLQALRKLKRLTRAEVGALVGVDAETVRAWECGAAVPHGDSRACLSNLYGVRL